MQADSSDADDDEGMKIDIAGKSFKSGKLSSRMNSQRTDQTGRVSVDPANNTIESNTLGELSQPLIIPISKGTQKSPSPKPVPKISNRQRLLSVLQDVEKNRISRDHKSPMPFRLARSKSKEDLLSGEPLLTDSGSEGSSN